MKFSQELLFFFSALGAFNGLILSFYFLFWAKPKHISNGFLGMLLLALSIRIGKSVFFYFNPNLAFLYLQIGLSACFFIGPFLYLYTYSIVRSESKSHWKTHLALLGIIILTIGLHYPFESNQELWRPYIIYGIYFQWLTYILLSSYLIKGVIRRVCTRDQKASVMDIWLFNLIMGISLIWLSYISFHYTYYIVGALSFSFMTYLLILLFIFRTKNKSIVFDENQKYRNKKIDDYKANDLIGKLRDKMLNDNLYKQANLKLSTVAEIMGWSSHNLSQLLNDNLNISFNHFVNEYRISEAKKMILEYENFTLEAIGYECGFNSKTAFYSSFKKITGTTPAGFKKS